jgi:thioredoxin-dependent peroxiredoxin
MMMTYPMTTGRNFFEILRTLDSLQLTAKHPVSTPANWNPGEDIIVSNAVPNEEAQTKFEGFKVHKPYLRTAKQPR